MRVVSCANAGGVATNFAHSHMHTHTSKVWDWVGNLKVRARSRESARLVLVSYQPNPLLNTPKPSPETQCYIIPCGTLP